MDRTRSQSPTTGVTRLKQVVLTGFAYMILGALGLALSNAPGYASPIFPAAGLAIAAALCSGTAILPGVWFGSFLLNCLVAGNNGTLTLVGLVVAAFIATGATVQTFVARLLIVGRDNSKWRTLEMERDVVRFLFLAAPVACLVSATVGTLTLFGTGIISTAELVNFWSCWWLGDTFGVLVFAPLTLIFLLRGESPWKERQFSVALPMLLTLCLITLVFLRVAAWEQQQLHGRIEAYGKNIAQLIDRRLVAHQEALASLRRLIEVTPDMSYGQFEYFTRITLKDNPDVFALGFNPLVDNRARGAFERVMLKKSPRPGYKITERNQNNELIPAAVRPYYVVVGYIAPLQGNLPAIGYDINSNAVRRAAIDVVRATGRPAITEPIRLVQEKQQRAGVLLLNPAYSNSTDAPGTGLSSLLGFSVGVLKVDEMVQIATAHLTRQDLIFQLADAGSGVKQPLFYHSDGGTQVPRGPYVWKSTFPVADRHWTLTVFPTQAYLASNTLWQTRSVGVVGLLFASLLQVLMLSMTGRAAVIQRKVAEQTAELTFTKHQLEELNSSLQKQVEESVAELRRKDQMLISQGRQAAMGEMISNIAHQWRQPLNALSLLIANLNFCHQEGDLSRTYMEKSVTTADRLLQKMSTTITDFSNFFRPEKQKVTFSARDEIQRAVNMVEDAYNSSNITVTIEGSDGVTLYGFPNEYSQVLLNLLANSRDAVVASATPEGRVIITVAESGGMGIVTVQDNGGGIPEDVIDKIFEPYFSTKQMGTGIGLYMSKMIIERNMEGRITAANREGGSKITLETPLGA